MKILYINQLDERGGAANLARSLMNQIKQRGYKVSMFVGKKLSTDNDIYSIQKPMWLFQIIKNITNRDPERFIKEKIFKIFPSDINFSNIKGLFQSKEYKEADIIHCHNLHAGFFNLQALERISKEKKVVWTLHDMWAITYGTPHTYSDIVENGFFQLPNNNKHSYFNSLINNKKYLENQKRKIYMKSDFHIVTPSMWLFEKVKKSVLKDKPIHLIHNGIDNNIFTQSNKVQTRKKLNLPQDKKIITFLADGGEDSDSKGWKYVEKIINHYKDRQDIIFLCIGNRNKHKQNDNEKIIFIDYISDKKIIAEYYSSSDIFLFTSIAENFPLVILEAMTCGLPIVSFDVGGVKEAISHKRNGYISKYCNIEDTIQGIEFVLGLTKQEKKGMAYNSKKRVEENFSLEIMTKKYMELYNEIIGQIS